MRRRGWKEQWFIQVVDRISFNDGLDKFRFTPMELRRILAEKKADAIFVFQVEYEKGREGEGGG